eukprot:4551801-Amphidinium_carterae.1
MLERSVQQHHQHSVRRSLNGQNKLNKATAPQSTCSQGGSREVADQLGRRAGGQLGWDIPIRSGSEAGAEQIGGFVVVMVEKEREIGDR